MIGEHGTRLCIVSKIEEGDNVFRVFLSDTICSADEQPGSSRELSFTHGAILGAIEEATGSRLSGKQIGSVLRGDDYDILEFTVR